MPNEFISVCPDCGKRQPKENAPCWLCGRKLGPENVVTEEQAKHLARYADIGKTPPGDDSSLNPASTALLALWIVVGSGAAVVSLSQAAIYFGITAPIALIIAAKNRAPRMEPDLLDRFADIALVLLTVAGIILLLIVGLIGALLLMCIANAPHFGH